MSEIRVAPSAIVGSEKVLTKEAIDFVVHLDQLFHAKRDQRLAARKEQREMIAKATEMVNTVRPARGEGHGKGHGPRGHRNNNETTPNA